VASRQIGQAGALATEALGADRVRGAPRGATEGALHDGAELFRPAEADKATKGTFGVACGGINEEGGHRRDRVRGDVQAFAQRGGAVPALKYELVNQDVSEAVDEKIPGRPLARCGLKWWQRLK